MHVVIGAQTSIAGAEIEHQNKTGPERTVRYMVCPG